MKEDIKRFVIQKIEELSKRFNQISFTYGFDLIAEQHIIDIDPNTEFNNEEYKYAEFEVISDFIDKFPNEQLLFISSDNYIKIVNPIYVKERCSFESISNVSKEMFDMELVTFSYNPHLDNSSIFSHFNNELFLPNNSNGLFGNSLTWSPIISSNIMEHFFDKNLPKSIHTLENKLIQVTTTEQIFSENNYAMAA